MLKIQKVKEKIVEDKTFGLKNKNKSKTVQQYVESVRRRVFDGNKKVCYHHLELLKLRAAIRAKG